MVQFSRATLYRIGPVLALSLVSTSVLACATCGCSMSSDGAMGYSDTSGWRVNLEYDYLNQNQLRNGTHSVSSAQVASINDNGGNQEVEHQTVNRYINLGISYRPNADWSISALIPYIDRSHSTYGNAGASQLTPDNISGADSSGMGDAKLIVSYQGLLPTHNLGVQLGVKLPTGNYGGQDANGNIVGKSPVFFNTGPNAGQALDTSLNPGTGSTDIILGAYYYQPVSQNFDAFANGQYQAAVMEKLNQAGADYRPGDLATISVGTRYEANPQWIPQVQLNLTHKNADSGALADTADTAGTVLYLSPGITATVVKNTQVYAFMQLPLYSKLSGYQLFPRWTASVGVSYAF